MPKCYLKWIYTYIIQFNHIVFVTSNDLCDAHVFLMLFRTWRLHIAEILALRGDAADSAALPLRIGRHCQIVCFIWHSNLPFKPADWKKYVIMAAYGLTTEIEIWKIWTCVSAIPNGSSARSAKYTSPDPDLTLHSMQGPPSMRRSCQGWRKCGTGFHQASLGWAPSQELHFTGLQIIDATLDLHLTCCDLLSD